MDSAAQVLRDIHGLDSIPWWPLAPGWWFLLGLIGLLLLTMVFSRWLIENGIWLGWRGDARRQLHALKKALPREDSREVAGRLSELLRRIAMVRSGRREAAGLTGDSWLEWLMDHDPTGFNWQKRGQLLLVAPYMPPHTEVERKELAKLIRAAIRWVDTRPPSPQPAGARERMAGALGALKRVVRV